MINFASFTMEKHKQLWCESASTGTMLDNILVLKQVSAPPYKLFYGQDAKLIGFYPSPKFFWSCTHVNSCQNYIFYINLYIFLNILCKTLNLQESRKFLKFLKR